MKTIRDFRFPVLVLIGSIIIVLFTSYGNKKVHPDLNEFMIELFQKQHKQGSLLAKDFKNYTFNLEGVGKIKGTAITKDGLFNVNDAAAGGVVAGIGAMVEKNVVAMIYAEEGPAEMTPKQWIITGGYSADVPEIPASLRHFYDPTKPAGDRYLTDITNAKIMGSLQQYAFTNPQMDGLKWALGIPGDKSNGPQDHQYTWERGKMWMQMALNETDQDKKNEYMAFAWRSLGETLHMIADHGCPPHVRNDAHPSPLWGNNNFFGNPDPYEEFMDIIRRDYPNDFINFAKGSPDPVLAQQFKGFTRAEEIAHQLAAFTNINFVTNETISGKDRESIVRQQITHPQYPYFSPILDQMAYDPDSYSYVSSTGIKQCTDRYYLANMIPKYCEPFVDIFCVQSQAKVLVPNLVEAGANVIKLFIPQLNVEINSLEKGVIKGRISHTTDNEYLQEILYTGKVTLEIKNSSNKLIDEKEADAMNGVFEKNLKLAKGEKVCAKIEFGGVEVRSEYFEGSETGEIFGIYVGNYDIAFNEANWADAIFQQDMKRNTLSSNPELREIEINNMREGSIVRVQSELSSRKYVVSKAKQAPRIKFEIFKPDANKEYYNAQGLKYTVRNSADFISNHLPQELTPLKDGSNPGTRISYSGNGFTAVTTVDDVTFTLTGTFTGNMLTGKWAATAFGKTLWTASFTTRKTYDAN
jgi:hypothetical protein